MFLEQISSRDLYGIKGILYEISNSSKTIDSKDSVIIKDIAYHFV